MLPINDVVDDGFNNLLVYFTQAVINSTITPNMTFTKTSQKFGQWSDVRANTVYGLGFSSEAELNKVSSYIYIACVCARAHTFRATSACSRTKNVL
jgi:hypothetical protein